LRRALAVLLLLSGSARAKGLVVSPSSVFLVAPSGAAAEGRLTLSGTTPEPTRVAVSARDFVLDAVGTPAWTSEPQPRGLESRLAAASDTVEIAGREAVPLAFRVTLPEGAEGSYWTALVLEAEPVTRSSAAGVEVDVVARLVVPVFVTVEGTSRGSARLVDLTARRLDGERVGVRLTLENAGSCLVRGLLLFSVEEESTGGAPIEVATAEIPDLLVLPGASRRVETLMVAQKDEAAPHRIRVFLEATGGQKAAAEALADIGH
jgi:hypothetical protein